MSLGGTSFAAAAKPAAPAAAVPAADETNFIWNNSGIGRGVIHVKDGNYADGLYDAVLEAQGATDANYGWTTVAGWYTGPGYCTEQWRSDPNTQGWNRQLPDLGSCQHFIGATTSYEAVLYHC